MITKSKSLLQEVKTLIIEHILKQYSHYRWYETGDNHFALAVMFNDKLEGVEWSIENEYNRPKIKISLSVQSADMLGRKSWVKVYIDEWNLISKGALCWNTHNKEEINKFRRIQNQKKTTIS